MEVAAIIVSIVKAYAAVGALVAAVFLLWGVDRVEPSARGAYVFRPLVAPGVIVLWPLVLWRWRALERGKSLSAAPDREAAS